MFFVSKVIVLVIILGGVTSFNARGGKILAPVPDKNINEINDFGSSFDKLSSDLIKILKGTLFRPIALLVDDTKASQQIAYECMLRILQSGLQNEFTLFKFNSTDSTPALANLSKDREKFFHYLIHNETSNAVGYNNETESVLFFAILQAIHSLPYNSVIFAFTQRRIHDEDLAQLTVRELRTQAHKLIVVWLGNQKYQHENVLEEVVETVGGNFFRIQPKEEDKDFLQIPEDKLGELAVFRTYLTGRQLFYFPIDSSTKSIHVSFSQSANRAILTPPNKRPINLLDRVALQPYEIELFVDEIGKKYEVHLLTRGNQFVGKWKLDVGDENAHAYYNVTVLVHTDLQISLHHRNRKSDVQNIQLGINRDIKSIDNITLHDIKGEKLNISVRYTLTQPKEVENINSTIDTNDINIDIPTLPKDPFLIRVDGKDNGGNDFVRLKYYSNNDVYNTRQLLTVNVAPGSNLLLTPGQTSTITFEVTNNYDTFIRGVFTCKDQRSMLVRMHPKGCYLNPKQKILVNVDVYANAGVGDDLVRFIVDGPTRVEKSVLLKVTNSKINDNELPHMWHSYTSDCINSAIGKCENLEWNIEVTAQDKESGLLLVTTGQGSLNMRDSFISGTTQEVVGYFRGSCCNPSIQLTAIDLAGNRRTYVADAYRAALGPGIIAAIVLGVLFIIILIIIIVVCIIKKRKASGTMDVLPNYRGPSSRY